MFAFARLRQLAAPNRLFLSVSFLLFFWTLYDGLISYLTPILISQYGFSTTKVGLIIATSSVAGAIFDFVLTKLLRHTNYLRLFLILMVICLSYPLLLWSSRSFLPLVFAMAVWGLYYDLLSFAVFDFTSQTSAKDEHCQNTGIITVFKSLGYLLAPILAGLIVTDTISFTPFAFAYLFLIISLLFYFFAFLSAPHHHQSPPSPLSHKRVNLLVELHLWRTLGKILFPVLVFNTLLYLYDATFWTIGPLFSTSFESFRDFGGLFMTLYTLPALFVGWLVEPLTQRFGKKRIAYTFFILGSVFLFAMGFLASPWPILALNFISAIFTSISYVAIKGAYVDYISETQNYQKEIEGLSDFTTNLGYVLGPALAGIIADWVGTGRTFSYLATLNILVVIILFFLTPKSIHIPKSSI
jgi:MFS family permease